MPPGVDVEARRPRIHPHADHPTAEQQTRTKEQEHPEWLEAPGKPNHRLESNDDARCHDAETDDRQNPVPDQVSVTNTIWHTTPFQQILCIILHKLSILYYILYFTYDIIPRTYGRF